MDRDTFLKKMKDAVNNPRLNALHVQIMTKGRQDNHYFEVYQGFVSLKKYAESYKTSSIEEAIRQFDYVQNYDKKYVIALSHYGKAIAYAYCQTGGNFLYSYQSFRKLFDISVWITTDMASFIGDLKTDAIHLQQDIEAWDSKLNPIMSLIRRWYIRWQ